MRQHFEEQEIATKALLLNWGLVMLWARFEAWLEELLLLFFRSRPEAFLGWGAERQIAYKNLITCENITEARETMYLSAVADFTSRPIGERLRHFAKKLNVPVESLFGTGNNIFDFEVEGCDMAMLTDVSNKRNEVVHEGRLPVMSLLELTAVGDGLINIVCNFGVIVAIKGNIRCTVIDDSDDGA